MEKATIDSYRYERKFFVSDLTKYEIEALIKVHPAMFLEIYQPRFINNIYLDSPGMQNYYHNVDGLSNRVKVRIRWYGDLFGVVEKPVLELKIKHGEVGRKESFPLVSFPVDEKLQHQTVIDVFERSEIPDILKLNVGSLECALLNRYQRKYFQTPDRKYRITIDSEMTFYQIGAHNNMFLHSKVDRNSTVVELKYELGEDKQVARITNHFPFRMTRSSKYVNGIEWAHL